MPRTDIPRKLYVEKSERIHHNHLDKESIQGLRPKLRNIENQKGTGIAVVGWGIVTSNRKYQIDRYNRTKMKMEDKHSHSGVAMSNVVVVGKRTHSKTGCITCKVRKKRCAEQRPVCYDCARLNLECVYPDNLTREQVKQCKLQLRMGLRKRKPKLGGSDEGQLILEDENIFAAPEPGLNRESEALELFPPEVHLDGVARSPVGEPNLDEEQGRVLEVSDTMLDIDVESLLRGIRTPDQDSFDEVTNHEFTGLDDEIKRDAGSCILSPRTDTALTLREMQLQKLQHPDPYLSQPLIDPSIHDLEPVGVHLYNYYREHLAKIICIAPTRQNFYLQCFLPMAHKHKGILYGILAWSAHHLSISNTSITHEASRASHAILEKDIHYSTMANKYIYRSLQYLQEPQDGAAIEHQNADSSFLYSLAQILVLCGAEICQGDVNRWQILLRTGAKLIKEHMGGSDLTSILSNNGQSNYGPIDLLTRNWLLANFIYHDIMGSQRTKFPMQQYETLLLASNQDFSDWNLNLDSLHGLNRPVFKLLGDTTNLIRQMKSEKLTQQSYNFSQIMFDALELNQKLLNISPNEKELMVLSHCMDDMDDNDDGVDYRELSEHLFEVFRLSALIHLKTTVLKVEKNTFELLFYTKTLLQKLDLVLGTRLEPSLCFPMFICGINCMDSDREDIENKFVQYINRYKCRNVVRAHDIMHKVWKMDDEGESMSSSGIRERDWFDVCDDMGWDISFA